MKKHLLALALALAPTSVFASCNGIFQPNTVCGNNSGSAREAQEFSFSGTLVGPGTTVVGDLATWGNTSGTVLSDLAPGALTGVNDTNVTVVLGGTPATALVHATSLTLGWTGQLSVSRGGTGIASGTSGGIPYFSTNTTIASSAVLNSLILGNGAGSAPTNYAGTTCAGTFIRSISNLGVATCQQINLTADVTGILPLANGGTGAGTQSGAATNIFPTPARAGDIAYLNGSAWVSLAGNNSGTQLLSENASGIPAWTTVSGTGTVTSIVFGGGLSGGTITTSGTVNIVAVTGPTFRVTLASGTPVMNASQSNQTTVYVTPYGGSAMPINNSGTMNLVSWSEVNQTVSDATKSPAATAANSVYDIFCWVDTGPTNRCTRGPAWTNSTTRGYTLTSVNGILTNTSAITNGPGAQAGTLVGTIKTNASANVDYTFGAAASGGSAAILGVWNAYNRVNTCTTVTDSGASYTYTSATVRQARASTGNQITILTGAAEDGIDATMNEVGITTGAAQAAVQWCIGLDTTSACSIQKAAIQAAAATSITGAGPNEGKFQAQFGVHVISANEAGDGSNANNFNTSSTNTLSACVRN